MFAKISKWLEESKQAHYSEQMIKNELPAGYFLAFVEVFYPGGALFCQDPVLVKKDPRKFKGAQEAAFIFPGFEEPMLYANQPKDVVEVKPFGKHNYLHFAKDTELYKKFVSSIDEAKIALDDPREKITNKAKKAVDELKVKIKEILGEKYFLMEVGTMLGTLPVITKTISNKSVPCAHIYPGAQTDMCDGAPKKSEERCYTIPPERINSWLSNCGEKVLENIKAAIVQLERPERFVQFYEVTKE